MLDDVVIVGAGPVRPTLALALADRRSRRGRASTRAPPSRRCAATARSRCRMARGSYCERLGVWGALAAVPDAATPITRIDISQAGGFGAMQLAAEEQGLPALGYVVSYRALQLVLDAALARSRVAAAAWRSRSALSAARPRMRR